MELFQKVPQESSGRCGDISIYEVPAHFQFTIPTKRVRSTSDMREWLKSQAHYDLMGFINGISLSVQGKQLSAVTKFSKNMANLLIVFEKLNKLLDETPVIDEPQRFGNMAFRLWFTKMNEHSFLYLLEALTEKYAEPLNELFSYFKESFGNPTRIDYGTGHELAFIMFLCGLFKVHALIESDSVACGLNLFNSYLQLVRRLQLTYRMEPAGSQGVWSLDDHQFLPYIWGSAQLALNSPFDPSKFLEDEYIQKYKDEYMFIGCIDYIKKVKTGHFAEHSNQLWSISAVQSWSKINVGLVKMYTKEILSKFPVIQHVLFGSIMSFSLISPDVVMPNVRLGLVPIPVRPTKVKTEPMEVKRCTGDIGVTESMQTTSEDASSVSVEVRFEPIFHKNVTEVASQKNIIGATSQKNIMEVTSQKNIMGATSQKNIMGATSQKNIMEATSQKNIMEATSQKNFMEAASQKSIMGAASQKNMMGATSQKNIMETATSQKSILKVTPQKHIIEATSQKNIMGTTSQKNFMEVASQRSLTKATIEKNIMEAHSQKNILGGTSQKSILGGTSQKSILGGTSQKSILGGASQKNILEEISQKNILGGTSQKSFAAAQNIMEAKSQKDIEKADSEVETELSEDVVPKRKFPQESLGDC